jgi:prophage regulatory protein
MYLYLTLLKFVTTLSTTRENKMNELTLIRLPEVCHRTQLSKATIYKMLSDGTFPKQVNLHERAVAFVAVEVDDWIKSRIAKRAA